MGNEQIQQTPEQQQKQSMPNISVWKRGKKKKREKKGNYSPRFLGTQVLSSPPLPPSCSAVQYFITWTCVNQRCSTHALCLIIRISIFKIRSQNIWARSGTVGCHYTRSWTLIPTTSISAHSTNNPHLSNNALKDTNWAFLECFSRYFVNSVRANHSCFIFSILILRNPTVYGATLPNYALIKIMRNSILLVLCQAWRWHI